MRTISRHLPKDAPLGETTVICDYCGIEWYRSKCRRDRAGLLACPRDMKGRDRVTLSEGNARAARLFRYKTPEENRGRKDRAGEQYATTPAGILGNLLLGWWKPSGVIIGTGDNDRIGNTVVSGQNYDVAAWRSEVTRYVPRVVDVDESSAAVGTREFSTDNTKHGMLVAVEDSTRNERPTLDMSAVRSTDGTRPTGTYPSVRFDTDSYMVAQGGPFMRGAVAATAGTWIGSNPCFWFVAARTDSSLLMPMVRLNGSSEIVRTLSLLHDSDDVVEATSWYASAGLVNLASDFTPDSSLRLYSVRMEPDQLVLKVSDTEWTQSTGISADSGMVADAMDLRVGRQGSVSGSAGDLNELVVTQGVPTAAQIASLEEYFLRVYPDMETTI